MKDVTTIVSAIKNGDKEATEKLLPLVYDELRTLAAAKLAREKSGQSLQPTVLVHEAYLRLVDVKEPHTWSGRGHFFGAAAEAMRRILVERARRRKSRKHGGEWRRVELDNLSDADETSFDDLLSLDDALTQFESLWPERARLVKLRYFAGLSIPEASETMGISTATAERYWRFARAWLRSQLSPEE